MYFEHNYPMTAPAYFSGALARSYEDTANRVHKRMSMLEDALEAFMAHHPAATEAQFAKTAKKVFDSVSVDYFDQIGSDGLEAAVTLLYDGTYAEPRINFPDAVTVVDAAFITVKEWELFRHLGIGGSDAAVIQGTSPYGTRRALYCDKAGIAPKADGKNPQFERGHEMEPKVIKAFANLTGATVIEETRMFRSALFYSPLADVDALVRMKDGRLFVFEAKTTVKDNIYHWRLGGQGKGYVPPYYVTQCRQYPAVLGSDEIAGTIIGCLFVDDTIVGGEYVQSSYDERDFLYRELARDRDEELRILLDDDEFFNSFIVPRKVPEMNTTVKARGMNGNISEELADMRLLRRLRGDPDKTEAPVELDDDDMRDLADSYLELAERKSSLTKQLEDISAQQKTMQAQIVPLLGTAAFGRIPVQDSDDLYYEVKYSIQKRKSVDMKLLADKYPDAYDECVQNNAIPMFSVTPRSKEKEADKARRRGRVR